MIHRIKRHMSECLRKTLRYEASCISEVQIHSDNTASFLLHGIASSPANLSSKSMRNKLLESCVLPAFLSYSPEEDMPCILADLLSPIKLPQDE